MFGAIRNIHIGTRIYWVNPKEVPTIQNNNSNNNREKNDKNVQYSARSLVE